MLFSSKCTSFTSCCAYQRIAWTAVKPDDLELQSSNICVLKADVDHHYPRSNSPTGPFKVHVATSSVHVRERGKGKKTIPQDLDAKTMLERRSIYYKIKFQILPHFSMTACTKYIYNSRAHSPIHTVWAGITP